MVSRRFRSARFPSKGRELRVKISTTYPAADRDWRDTDWKQLIDEMIGSGLVTYKDVASVLLGQLNPPQVGTQIASKDKSADLVKRKQFWENWAAEHPGESFMPNVMKWLYAQNGDCEDCHTMVDLQADHVIPRQTEGAKADRLDNLVLRCRRHNVAKRPSHLNANLTYLTAESGLMWLLMVKQPPTYQTFARLCRDYGLTMADIRFQEAWAMARWLERRGLYTIDPTSSR
jgi:hypothetical protein